MITYFVDKDALPEWAKLNIRQFVSRCRTWGLDCDEPRRLQLGELVFWPNPAYPFSEEERLAVLAENFIKCEVRQVQYAANYFDVPPDTLFYLQQIGLTNESAKNTAKLTVLKAVMKKKKIDNTTFKLVVSVNHRSYRSKGRWFVFVSLYNTQPGQSKHGRRKTVYDTIDELHSWTHPMCWPSIDTWIRVSLAQILPQWPKE